MGIFPSHYRWRPDEHYRSWHICNDCLIPLADALQDRVEKWVRPPKDEENDDRPDYHEIIARRYRECFAPLDAILKQYDLERGIIWLNIYAPAIATKLEAFIDLLRMALIPPSYDSLNTDEAVVVLANTSFLLQQIAQEISPLAEKDGKKGNGVTGRNADSNTVDNEENKPPKKRGSGRKKDPKVQDRNKKIVADFKNGLTVDDVTEKYKISADLARRVKSNAENAGKTAKNRQL